MFRPTVAHIACTYTEETFEGYRLLAAIEFGRILIRFRLLNSSIYFMGLNLLSLVEYHTTLY